MQYEAITLDKCAARAQQRPPLRAPMQLVLQRLQNLANSLACLLGSVRPSATFDPLNTATLRDIGISRGELLLTARRRATGTTVVQRASLWR